MSRLTLTRELDVIVRKRHDPLRDKSEKKTLLNLALQYVIHSVAEFFSFKFLLHILGQTKRQILKDTIITDIGFCVFISLQ